MPLETFAPPLEEADAPRYVRTSPLTVADDLPKAMGPRDMQRAFNVSAPTFFRKQREGIYRPFEFARIEVGPKRYSGEKVQQFLNGRR